jgi:hypothetical protein
VGGLGLGPSAELGFSGFASFSLSLGYFGYFGYLIISGVMVVSRYSGVELSRLYYLASG